VRVCSTQGMGGSMTESLRESILLDGKLSGMGYQVPCRLRAMKVSLPLLRVWEYVGCSVVQAPGELPDGLYDATFDGRTMQLKKLDGDWLDGSV